MPGFIKRIFSKNSEGNHQEQNRNRSHKKQSKAIKKNKLDPNSLAKANILTRDQHCISRKNISNNALKVLYKLNEAGYQSYLVGGGVRDLLLGLSPKDFDVATDATPEEIKTIFRNCRLVGRRFRLAHILFGREVIEVATFRASHEQDTSQPAFSNHNRPSDTRPKYFKGKNDQTRTSDHGMLTRDNVYGSMIEDAFRRDFTVNALYYTVSNFSIIDYTQGLQDLAERKLRLIGDPVERYREDPVRILRAIRLSSKLGLTIEKNSKKPIKELAALLRHVSSARLWDETNKLLLAGHAEKTWVELCKQEVAQYLFPQTIASLENSKTSQTNSPFNSFIFSALKNTDKRIKNEQPVTPAFLYAVFLWQPLQEEVAKLQRKGFSVYEAHLKAASRVMEIQRDSINMPKRFSAIAKEIWSLQHRLTNLKRKSVYSLASHIRFRAAYDFLCLRAGDDPELHSLANWWTDFQECNSEQQETMIRNSTPSKAGKRRPQKRKKK